MNVVLLTLHITGAGILVGMEILALVLVLAAKNISSEKIQIFQLFSKIGLFVAILQTITGIGLYLREPAELNNNPLFWIKLGLFILGGVIATQVIDKKIKHASAQKEVGALGNQISTWFSLSLAVTLTVIAIGVTLAESH